MQGSKTDNSDGLKKLLHGSLFRAALAKLEATRKSRLTDLIEHY